MTSPFQATWLRRWWCSQRDPCGNSWMTGPGTLCSPLQYSMLVQLCITFVSVSLLGLSMFIKPEELSRSTQSVHAGSSWIMLDHAVVSSLIGQADRLIGWTWLKLNSAVPMGRVTRGKVLPNFVTAVRVRVPQGRGREPKGTEGKPWMLQMYGSFHSSHSNTAKGFLWAPHFLKPWWLANPWDVGSWWSNYFQKSLGLWAVAIQVPAEAM